MIYMTFLMEKILPTKCVPTDALFHKLVVRGTIILDHELIDSERESQHMTQAQLAG